MIECDIYFSYIPNILVSYSLCHNLLSHPSSRNNMTYIVTTYHMHLKAYARSVTEHKSYISLLYLNKETTDQDTSYHSGYG